MKIKVILAVLIIAAMFSAKSPAEEKIRLYRTSSELIYMRVTEVIYKDYLIMEGDKKKEANAGSRFAEIVINFANLTDQPIKDYGLHPVDLSVSPKNLALIGDNGKGYSGMKATMLMAKKLNPFVEDKILKPGEDMVRVMCFLIPEETKITGVRYTFGGGQTLNIDYNDKSQLQPEK